MQYNPENSFINSEDGNNNSLSKEYFSISNYFSSASDQSHIVGDIHHFNNLTDNFFHSKHYRNNEEISLIDKNNEYYTNKERLETFNRDNKNSEDCIKVHKSKECKDNETSNENYKRIIFNPNYSFSEKQQMHIKKEKNNNVSVLPQLENTKSKNKHTKFSDDNLRRKCKVIVLSSVRDFINGKLTSIYKSKEKQIMTLNKSQTINSKINDNKDFMKKSLGEIFSDSISTKYTSFLRNKNEKLITELLNEKDEAKRIYFQKLFALSFLECIDHFSNKKPNELLKGMKQFEQFKNQPLKLKKNFIDSSNEDYMSSLEYYLMNYENILNRKNSRRKRHEKKEVNTDDFLSFSKANL